MQAFQGLSHSTFGPTRSEIAALETSIDEGVGDIASRELAAFRDGEITNVDTPSLHRAYYRRRVNPRVFRGLVMPIGSGVSPCDTDRWKRYALMS